MCSVPPIVTLHSGQAFASIGRPHCKTRKQDHNENETINMSNYKEHEKYSVARYGMRSLERPLRPREPSRTLFSMRSNRFVLFRSNERPRDGILGFGRARYERSAIFRAVFYFRSSFFAFKPYGNACYAGLTLLGERETCDLTFM